MAHATAAPSDMHSSELSVLEWLMPNISSAMLITEGTRVLPPTNSNECSCPTLETSCLSDSISVARRSTRGRVLNSNSSLLILSSKSSPSIRQSTDMLEFLFIDKFILTFLQASAKRSLVFPFFRGSQFYLFLKRSEKYCMSS